MLNVLIHTYLWSMPLAFISCIVYSGYETTIGTRYKDRWFDWENETRTTDARGLSLFATLLGIGLWPIIVFGLGPYEIGKRIGRKSLANAARAKEHKEILDTPIEKLLSA